jgi:putative membrane protein
MVNSIADFDDYSPMMGWEHMMDWWGIPFMGFMMIGVWLVFIVIAFLVYQDASKRGMNGLLWFILVILPMIGIVFLIIYLIIRDETPAPQPVSQKNTKQILDERYAKGEISKEEYQSMKKDIKK